MWSQDSEAHLQTRGCGVEEEGGPKCQHGRLVLQQLWDQAAQFFWQGWEYWTPLFSHMICPHTLISS